MGLAVASYNPRFILLLLRQAAREQIDGLTVELAEERSGKFGGVVTVVVGVFLGTETVKAETAALLVRYATMLACSEEKRARAQAVLALPAEKETAELPMRVALNSAVCGPFLANAVRCCEAPRTPKSPKSPQRGTRSPRS